MENANYVLETRDLFGNPAYYTGRTNSSDIQKALRYTLDDAMAKSRELNRGNVVPHYRCVRSVQ